MFAATRMCFGVCMTMKIQFYWTYLLHCSDCVSADIVVCNNDNSRSMGGTLVVATNSLISKRMASAAAASHRGTWPNTKVHKERQSIWNSPMVMVLIHSKEKDHIACRLTFDAQDNMEMATVKWGRIADNIAKISFSQYYHKPSACKDKWRGLFKDYKKIEDYKIAMGLNEEYFRMGSKRTKELCLPANFCSIYCKEMDHFLHQCPTSTSQSSKTTSFTRRMTTSLWHPKSFIHTTWKMASTRLL